MIKNNMANGIGRYYHDVDSSHVYEGYFVNNKKQGFGRFVHSCCKYHLIGIFDNDMPNGF